MTIKDRLFNSGIFDIDTIYSRHLSIIPISYKYGYTIEDLTAIIEDDEIDLGSSHKRNGDIVTYTIETRDEKWTVNFILKEDIVIDIFLDDSTKNMKGESKELRRNRITRQYSKTTLRNDILDNIRFPQADVSQYYLNNAEFIASFYTVKNLHRHSYPNLLGIDENECRREFADLVKDNCDQRDYRRLISEYDELTEWNRKNFFKHDHQREQNLFVDIYESASQRVSH